MTKKNFPQKKYLSKSPSQTRAIGLALAKKLSSSKKKRSGALLLGLEGDLGGGKTTFLQGFAKGLGIKEKILSPTFIILKKFEINPLGSRKQQRKSKFENFYHIDCYRIKRAREILNLGFGEIISNPYNIVVIEWVDRVAKIIPSHFLKLHFQFIDDKTREIKTCVQ